MRRGGVYRKQVKNDDSSSKDSKNIVQIRVIEGSKDGRMITNARLRCFGRYTTGLVPTGRA